MKLADVYFSYMIENPHKNNAPLQKSLVLMQVKHTRHSCDGHLAISWRLPVIL